MYYFICQVSRFTIKFHVHINYRFSGLSERIKDEFTNVFHENNVIIYTVCVYYTSYAMLLSDIPWHIPQFSCTFAVYTQALRRVFMQTNYKWQVGYSILCCEKALHKLLIFIPFHRKYMHVTLDNQCSAQFEGILTLAVFFTVPVWHGVVKGNVYEGEWRLFFNYC